MAHYAFLDKNNIVILVIVGNDENSDVYDWEIYYGSKKGLKCKRTSYNTQGGTHLLGGTPFRKNYAGVGYTYDEQRDAFIPPKPFNSWTLNEETCLWESPTPYPNDDKFYTWDEDSLSWVELQSM